MSEVEDEPREYPWRRVFSAIVFAATIGLGIYFLLEAGRPNAGVISISFLLILPAVL